MRSLFSFNLFHFLTWISCVLCLTGRKQGAQHKEHQRQICQRRQVARVFLFFPVDFPRILRLLAFSSGTQALEKGISRATLIFSFSWSRLAETGFRPRPQLLVSVSWIAALPAKVRNDRSVLEGTIEPTSRFVEGCMRHGRWPRLPVLRVGSRSSIE